MMFLKSPDSLTHHVQMILQSKLDLRRQVTDAATRKTVSLIVFVSLRQKVSSD